MFKLGLLALAAFLVSGPALAKPPVWIVRDADSEVLIFGSVHVLPPGRDWRPTKLDLALTAADDLWFELPMGQATEAEIAGLAASKGVLPLTSTSAPCCRRPAPPRWPRPARPTASCQASSTGWSPGSPRSPWPAPSSAPRAPTPTPASRSRSTAQRPLPPNAAPSRPPPSRSPCSTRRLWPPRSPRWRTA
uniref:TraB/GumN family protein n=1 Tax=Phenylobacterium glaciei TaxID=2803784 RepID=A0A974P559_9CAUL|nr:TraB/GumN family protein [Phenylobacterium glaciei]